MATGASTSEAALILVDARKGVVAQTKRHSHICALLGITHVALVVNKIDLVAYAKDVFDEIARAYLEFAAPLGFRSIVLLPISAKVGDNVVSRSRSTDWYDGPTLLDYLESVDPTIDLAQKPFRFPVQWVNRPHQDFRGFTGTVESGRVRQGDEITVAASGRRAQVGRIVTADGDLTEATAGDAVTLLLTDEVDVARGDLLTRPSERPEVSDQLAAHLLWMADEPMLPGRSYLMRASHQFVPARITTLKYVVDIDSAKHVAATTLGLNDIGVCNIDTVKPIAFDPYVDNRHTGAFVLIDRVTNATVAAGMISYGLRRATNVHRQNLLIDKQARVKLAGHRPVALWFTGLSGSGKSTIANLVERELHARGVHTYMLDGDNVRHGLSRDLGFTPADRVENIRRVGEVAKLFVDAGLVVLCSFISPFLAERVMVRELLDAEEFIEVFVDAPLDECARRDPKGLYARARSGLLKNFTGIDSPYEPPDSPELTLHTDRLSAEQCASLVIDELVRRRICA
jgi:bifunctional enzyme CysN/CysC